MWGSQDNRDADEGMERSSPAESDAFPPEPRCDQIEPLLQAAHEETLDPAILSAVLAHIGTCPRCGPRFEQRLAGVYTLARMAPELEPPLAIQRRLYARINAARRTISTSIHTSRKVFRLMRDIQEPGASNEQVSPPPARPARKLGVWIGAVAALLVVGRLGTVLFSLARLRGERGDTPDAPRTTGCAANAIKAQLPPRVYLNDLAMVSSDEGWAVGATVDGKSSTAMIFHYQQCRWTALPQTYSDMMLDSVSMVSATEGWAVGGNPTVSTGQPLALHYTGGAWRQLAIPLPSGSGAFLIVRMLNEHEGWILAVSSKGPPYNMLLHFRNGAWTPVALPFSDITDIAPVGVDDLWIVRGSTETSVPSELAHYQAGKWSSVPTPVGVMLSHLRANAPTDIYAMGSVQAASGVPSDATPADLHYAGASWTRLPLTGHGVGQSVEMLSATDGWAFHWGRGSDADPNDYIARADHLMGATAQPTAMPTNDLNFIHAITPMPDGSYWAIGGYVVKSPSDIAGYYGNLFLRFADGKWSQYGHI